ncbi:hypothetical protein QAD02_022068 [Eretmocerus hayati]|uniref:Uncharacterized protein n=1 Tax=Eretmocerus hayati TaxID=131215 RepID=A0ACC2PRQ0_9HYME|nr:hypothetical protein QAD02_022068 [Eretmocerus hayati]
MYIYGGPVNRVTSDAAKKLAPRTRNHTAGPYSRTVIFFHLHNRAPSWNSFGALQPHKLAQEPASHIGGDLSVDPPSNGSSAEPYQPSSKKNIGPTTGGDDPKQERMRVPAVPAGPERDTKFAHTLLANQAGPEIDEQGLSLGTELIILM